MNIPFSRDAFIAVFTSYNVAVWPAQIVLNLIALAILFFLLGKGEWRDRTVSGLLAGLWIWSGAVYHFTFFSSINQAAVVFGAAFVFQAGLLLLSGVLRHSIHFHLDFDARGITGIVLVLYALVVYPILAWLLGHRYPAMPTFGVPCPTVIFTFGLFIWAARSVPRYLLIIPVLWAVVGVSAVVKLGMLEDIGLPIAGLAGLYLIMRAKRKTHVEMRDER